MTGSLAGRDSGKATDHRRSPERGRTGRRYTSVSQGALRMALQLVRQLKSVLEPNPCAAGCRM